MMLVITDQYWIIFESVSGLMSQQSTQSIGDNLRQDIGNAGVNSEMGSKQETLVSNTLTPTEQSQWPGSSNGPNNVSYYTITLSGPYGHCANVPRVNTADRR